MLRLPVQQYRKMEEEVSTFERTLTDSLSLRIEKIIDFLRKSYSFRDTLLFTVRFEVPNLLNHLLKNKDIEKHLPCALQEALISRVFCYEEDDFVMAKLLIDHGVNDWSESIKFAAEYDLKEIEKIIEKDPSSRNFALLGSIKGGHIDLFISLLEDEVDNLEEALGKAAYHQRLDMISILIDKGANDWNRSMVKAAKGGSLFIVKIMASMRANDWNNAMCSAIRSKDYDIVEFTINKKPVTGTMDF